MSNVPQQLKVPLKNPVDKSHWQALQQIYQQVAVVINKQIEFGNPTSGSGNIKGQWGKSGGTTQITTPGAPNTDFTVIHNLGSTVVGIDIKTKDRAVDVYMSPSANPNPNTQVILRATVASAKITLFLH